MDMIIKSVKHAELNKKDCECFLEYANEFFFFFFIIDDVIESFQNMCLEIYELDPTCFLSATG